MPLRLAIIAATSAAILATLAPAALAKDRNHDRIPDAWERAHHLSLKVKQTRHDQDHDGLRNLAEYRTHSNPRDADTDDDGVEDGDELAGTISSFDGTTLTIALAAGGTLSATVVDGVTEIECDDHHGDNRGPGGDDDHGDHRGHGGDDDATAAASSHGDDDASCGVDALKTGTVVKEAQVRTTGGKAVLEKLELRP